MSMVRDMTTSALFLPVSPALDLLPRVPAACLPCSPALGSPAPRLGSLPRCRSLGLTAVPSHLRAFAVVVSRLFTLWLGVTEGASYDMHVFLFCRADAA